MIMTQEVARIEDSARQARPLNWARIVSVESEIPDVSTYGLRFEDPAIRSTYTFEAGQFNMLYVPGFGEAAISISSDPGDPTTILHTVRFVGNVTRAISRLQAGSLVGVRGPFGSAWPLSELTGKDLFIACGGIGLPPLRPALHHIVNHRESFGKVTLLYGARSPAELMYVKEYDRWREAKIEVETTVDRADSTWDGRVGVVPMWFYNFRIDPHNTAVLTCGPEIMIRFVIFEALARRVTPESIYVSLERNMKCGQGSCGHCQIGPYFICKDGPVFRFDALEPFFNVEEY
jgi:NAD(P)H-flavin reductase